MSLIKVDVIPGTRPEIAVHEMAWGTVFYFPDIPDKYFLRTQELVLTGPAGSAEQGFVALDGWSTRGKNWNSPGIPVAKAVLTITR